MKKYNLEMTSMYCSGLFIDQAMKPHEEQAIYRALQFVLEAGCKHLILGGGMNPDGVYTTQDYDRFYDTLHTIGRYCNDCGVSACYHPHSGTMAETGEQLARLMRNTDAALISLAPDTAHMVRGGIDPVDAIYTYADRIKYMHLKDIRDDEFYELGKGVIAWRDVLRALHEINYDGWAVIELDDTSHTPLESAVISRRYIENELELTV